MPDPSAQTPGGGVPDAVSTDQLRALLDPMPPAAKGLSIDFSESKHVADLMVAIRSGLMSEGSSCTMGQAVIAAASMAALVQAGFEDALQAAMEGKDDDPGYIMMARVHLHNTARIAATYSSMAAGFVRSALLETGAEPEEVFQAPDAARRVGEALISREILEKLEMPIPQTWEAFGGMIVEGYVAPDNHV